MSQRKIKLQAIYSCKDCDEAEKEFDEVSSCLGESSSAAASALASEFCCSLSLDNLGGDVSVSWTVEENPLGLLMRDDASSTDREGEVMP